MADTLTEQIKHINLGKYLRLLLCLYSVKFMYFRISHQEILCFKL